MHCVGSPKNPRDARRCHDRRFSSDYTYDMNPTIPAIYDAGVFRPLTPVDLPDGTQVEVQVSLANQGKTTRWRPLIDNTDTELIEQAALDPELDF